VATLQGQQILAEALNDFPVNTVNVEYENLTTLRTNPNYGNLQKQYFAQPFGELEEAFLKAGISPEDINELVIGSRAPHLSGSAMYGIITGALSIKTKGLIRAHIEQSEVDCLPTEETGLCFAQLDGVKFAFGSFSHLYAMLQARQGLTPALASNRTIADLLSNRAAGEPSQGLGNVSQLDDYIRSIVPRQLQSLTNGSKLFSDVQTFSYGISFGDKATIRLELACKSSMGATTLRQLLTSIAGMQSGLGKNTPIQHMEVAGSDSVVSLSFDSEIFLKSE
jgi:hypothetical protein